MLVISSLDVMVAVDVDDGARDQQVRHGLHAGDVINHQSN